jgi:ketosteroid isomerase-like protein
MSDSPDIELLHHCWQAMRNGDLTVLQEALAEHAIWRGVVDGPGTCVGRSMIIEVMGRNSAGPREGAIEETIQTGPHVIVGFRPERPSEVGNRPLEDGIAYMVVTFADGKIIELKGCANRAAAISYAHTGQAPDATASTEVPPPLSTGVHPPEVLREPPEQRVNRLVPFVKVTDVERSVAFYYHLGFTVESVHKYRDRLAWAALESDGAEVMFEGTNEPIDHARQGVLFYLYSHDLAALRDQLLGAGIEAGEIEDGSPGPRQQMRVSDPDGYVAMVAQID